jgi:acyl-coenzyme A synthetase/AMP-(fatty) acid ligase
MRIDAGNNQISITYLLTRKRKSYQLNEIIQWREHVVKVGKTSTYRELELMVSKNKKITVGHKEYTEYDKIIIYLKKKAPRKELKSEK